MNTQPNININASSGTNNRYSNSSINADLNNLTSPNFNDYIQRRTSIFSGNNSNSSSQSLSNQDLVLQDKVKRASNNFSLFLQNLLNQNSLNFYKINDFCQKKCPKLIAERDNLISINTNLNSTLEELGEVEDSLSYLNQYDLLNQIDCRIQESINLLTKLQKR
ncbi:hypothetical protein CONCODRAFT_9639 [Conidiobolus coronatus NRRL 28638]|uniref:Uncharacterized protein n=1 Tax=Conidiobolus coronatus (strain ATCC 28846 / CBS 209.66 / NRRL 28638) TaxID=796925 RepID=A0A137NZX5_CONC2|nr:hypothetical protein CONCODRAFT_9639 [Conidiobolus coronatus NRRL 28638]|eukprot:KXN68164.1 hypothetical protein CONCODRAFT_9639 [Conidiobolus coronatus NRRL 28638]